MKIGHANAQQMFAQLGEALGFRTLRTWSRRLPTDGVWVTAGDNGGIGHVPVAAIEVIVSERAKTMRGSIATLAAVSPALAVLLVQNCEIRRGLIKRGMSSEQAENSLARQLSWLRHEVNGKSQRFAVWTYEELARRHELAFRQNPLGLAA